MEATRGRHRPDRRGSCTTGDGAGIRWKRAVEGDRPTDLEIGTKVHTGPRSPADDRSPGPPRARRGVVPAPYCPYLNPIEMILAKIKQLLRSLACRTRDTLWKAMQSLLDQISQKDAANCFRHCGYTLQTE